MEGNAKQRELNLQQEVEMWKNKLSEKQSELDSAQDEIRSLQNQNNDLVMKIKLLEGEISEMKDEIRIL